MEEIAFLYEMVEEIEAVEKNIGLMQTLMFAFNLIKYNIVLSNKFISNLTPNLQQEIQRPKMDQLLR